MRRMVAAPEGDRGGGASDGLCRRTALEGRSARSAEANVCAGPVGTLDTAARLGGTGALDDCIWQQEWAAIMAESQSIIMVLQHGRQAAGARQARTGVAAHRATITSNTIAPFLPMFIS